MIYNEISKLHITEPTAVVIGKFDGFHKGHQKLIKKALEIKAQHEGLKVCAFVIIGAVKGEPIISVEERCNALRELGVDYIIACQFTEDIRTMSAEDFLYDVILGKLNAKYIVAGPDVKFGHMGAGDMEYLRRHEDTDDFKLVIIEKELYKERAISSTRIKDCIAAGDIDSANAMLGNETL